MTETRPCQACGVAIRFVRSPSSAWMPVQRVPAVYQVVADDHAEPRARRIELADHTGGLWVSHFAACPKASQFSRRRKGETHGAEGH